LDRCRNINSRELKKREKRKSGNPLSIGIIGIEGEWRESRHRERRLIAREFFSWVAGKKYELRRVIERG
jgi:hypothetical protein